MYENKQFPKAGRLDKIKKFFDGRGFYIALSLCAVAIISVTYITVKRSVEITDVPLPRDPTEQASQNVTDIPAPTVTPEKEKPAKPPIAPPVESQKNQTVSEKPAEPEKPVEQVNAKQKQGEKTEIFVLPNGGKILFPFSNSEKIYSQSMKDWRLHQAVDILGEEGSRVKAFSGGTVKRVYEDPFMGHTVELAHSGKRVSIYQNLQEGITVAEGDKVAAGDVLGGIGRSAAAEYLEKPHLHFEVWEDGVPVDPLALIQKQG